MLDAEIVVVTVTGIELVGEVVVVALEAKHW